MKRMKILVGLLVCGIVITAFADSNKQTYRDAQGRNMGSASTDRYGKTTYRDSMGRNQGSSSTDRYGKTTYRDLQGRIQSTSSTDKYAKRLIATHEVESKGQRNNDSSRVCGKVSCMKPLEA